MSWACRGQSLASGLPSDCLGGENNVGGLGARLCPSRIGGEAKSCQAGEKTQFAITLLHRALLLRHGLGFIWPIPARPGLSPLGRAPRREPGVAGGPRPAHSLACGLCTPHQPREGRSVGSQPGNRAPSQRGTCQAAVPPLGRSYFCIC